MRAVFRAVQRWKPPKQHVNLKFLELEHTKRNSKGVLRTGTARSKYLKQNPDNISRILGQKMLLHWDVKSLLAKYRYS